MFASDGMMSKSVKDVSCMGKAHIKIPEMYLVQTTTLWQNEVLLADAMLVMQLGCMDK